MAKLPALQFYPGDWKKDMGVQALELYDRGLWFEMLLLMHDSDERGKLVLNGRPMPHGAIARAIGIEVEVFELRLTLLLELGVASLEPETGVIYCRRMVKDEKNRLAHTEAGKKGGNPKLVNQKSNQTSNQKPTPSSSYSTTENKSGVESTEPDLSVAVRLCVCAHPKSRQRSLKPNEVSQRDETAVLEAMMHEVSTAKCSGAQALEMMLSRTEMLADKVPRAQWRYFKDVSEFFRNHWYRLEAEDLTKGERNGVDRPDSKGAAVGRVNRSGAGFGAVTKRRVSEASGTNVAADVGSVPTPGSRSGNGGSVLHDIREPGDAIRNAESRDGPAIIPDAPEILPPSQRSPRGS
jgi:hypothetical protein